MSSNCALSRSPELLSRSSSGLLVVDVQQKLIPHVADSQRIVWNIGRLLDGARIFGVPVIGTEQYPQGLGSTVESLAKRFTVCPDKLTFSCLGIPDLFAAWSQQGIYQILVVGIEAHVCITQTVLDLLHVGFRVFVAADATGSRSPFDYQTALRRIESAGATIITTESALFEWCERSGTEEFKQIRDLVRQLPPGSQSNAAASRSE